MDLCTLGSTKTTFRDSDHEISDGDGEAVERPPADVKMLDGSAL